MGLFILAIFIVIEILFINGGNETWENQIFVDSYFKLIIYQITIISCIFSNAIASLFKNFFLSLCLVFLVAISYAVDFIYQNINGMGFPFMIFLY